MPVVVGPDMMDDVRANGDSIDVRVLSKGLGLRVVPISASKAEGVDALLEQVRALAEQGDRSKALDLCTGEVHKAIHSVAHIIEDHAQAAGLPHALCGHQGGGGGRAHLGPVAAA